MSGVSDARLIMSINRSSRGTGEAGALAGNGRLHLRT
jgi:hypothetical protein